MVKHFFKKSPILKEYFEIKLTPVNLAALRSKLPPDILIDARRNSKKIRVYKLIYFSNKHKVIGFLVVPRNIKGKLPCIIWNRGGSNDFGAIKLGHIFTTIADFAISGYAVFASQYSGNSGSEGKDEFGGSDIADVLNLYKIIKICSIADSSRVGIYGHSRGGLMTYLSLARVKWIRAAVAVAAPSDEVDAPSFRKGWREHQINMYGGKKTEQVKRSAVYWADKFPKKTPILIMHGTADWRVNPRDSIRLAEKLLKYKKPFRLVMFEGGDHSLTEHEKEYKQLSLEWFERFLKKNESTPDTKSHGA